MSFNKIAGQTQNPPMLPIALAGGQTFLLPVGQGVVGTFGGATSPQIQTNNPLTGQYAADGAVSTLQCWDPGAHKWNDISVDPNSLVTVSADGLSYRLANTTGCPVGAIITTAGSGLTNGFYGYNSSGSAINWVNGYQSAGNSVLTITPSAGGSLWDCIIGGAVNTTVSSPAPCTRTKRSAAPVRR